MKTKKLLFLLALFTIFISNAQRKIFDQTIEKVNPKNGKIRCVSKQYENHIRSITNETEEQFETWLAQKINENTNKKTLGVNTVYTIPVVVHVIHNGDAVGSGENISDAQVLSQITVLNQDFRRMINTNGYNTNTVGADVEIEFCMAQQKPDGTATNGINRVNLGVAQWKTTNSVQTNLKPNTQWDPTKYFNIWVAYFSDNSNDALYGILGYAQFPQSSGLSGLSGTTTANTDGVVIDFRYFGSQQIAPNGTYDPPYNLGRTATHEIGHCFGLRHIWGDGNGDEQTGVTDCTATDYCNDTPQAGYEHYDCATVYNTCPNSPGNDMTENYMDYSNDACMNIFTVDQKTRVQTVLTNSPRRASLKTSIACQAPLADNDYNLLQGLNIYPNPAKDNLNISTSEIFDSVKVYNNLGQLVDTKIDKFNSIDITGLSKGVYFLKINKNSFEKTFKFIKE